MRTILRRSFFQVRQVDVIAALLMSAVLPCAMHRCRAEELSKTGAGIEAWEERLHGSAIGTSVFSQGDRIEYHSGNMPLIIAAPHGGRLKPSDLPDRTEGVLSSDTNVDRLAREICQHVGRQLAAHQVLQADDHDQEKPAADKQLACVDSAAALPHLVLCHVHRSKLDANRPLAAACATGSPAELHWHEYQRAIEHAKRTITDRQQRGLFVEIHGHAHPQQRLELGYLLRAKDFDLPTSEFNLLATRSSLREIAARGQVDFEHLVRGPASLGHLLAEEGIDSVPSPRSPAPRAEPYFNGGWNTLQHGSRDQGTISSLQIECHYKGIRDSQQSIDSAAAAMSRALRNFLQLHYRDSIALGRE